MAKAKRVSTRIRTRKLDRALARNVMTAKGITQFNKNKTGKSFFAQHWREYV